MKQSRNGLRIYHKISQREACDRECKKPHLEKRAIKTRRGIIREQEEEKTRMKKERGKKSRVSFRGKGSQSSCSKIVIAASATGFASLATTETRRNSKREGIPAELGETRA